jgi:hypothetical protein
MQLLAIHQSEAQIKILRGYPACPADTDMGMRGGAEEGILGLAISNKKIIPRRTE